MAKVLIVVNGKPINLIEELDMNEAVEMAQFEAFSLPAGGHAAALFDNMTAIPDGKFISPLTEDVEAEIYALNM